MGRNRYTKEFLERVIKAETTWAGVCRTIGIKPFTGAQTHMQRRAAAFQIDASHFTGKGWSKGREFLNQRTPLEEYLVKGSTIASMKLRDKLIVAGLKEAKCEICGLSEWRGRPMPLELDHKNSDHWDNRIENLQIVCANCHSQETSDRRVGTPAGERSDLGSDEAKAVEGSNPFPRTVFDIANPMK